MKNLVVVIGITAILATDIIVSIIKPIQLPSEVVTGMTYFAESIMKLDGIFPMIAFFDAFWIIFGVYLAIAIFRIFFGLLGLMSGSDKIDI